MDTKSSIRCYVLPIPSTAMSDVRLEFPGGHLSLRFMYDRNGSAERGELRFEKVRAHRHRAELYCTAEQIEAAYDMLVEIRDSEWVTDLLAAAPEDQRESWAMHHYMIYFDSSGCYEVVSASWAAPPDELQARTLG